MELDYKWILPKELFVNSYCVLDNLHTVVNIPARDTKEHDIYSSECPCNVETSYEQGRIILTHGRFSDAEEVERAMELFK